MGKGAERSRKPMEPTRTDRFDPSSWDAETAWHDDETRLCDGCRFRLVVENEAGRARLSRAVSAFEESNEIVPLGPPNGTWPALKATAGRLCSVELCAWGAEHGDDVVPLPSRRSCDGWEAA